MKLPFKRSSLVAQVADAIRTEILRGAWRDWLPSERDLGEILHVSRNTCRDALEILRREGLIESLNGRGSRVNQIVASESRGTASLKRSVGIVIPDQIRRLRPKLLLIMDELKDQLFERDVLVQLHASQAYYARAPDRALGRLVKQYHHDCWVLFMSSEPMQSWFMQRRLPCIVSGPVYKGIRLPSVGINYRAICRHAVGKLIALGHRRLVFLNRGIRNAGDLESEDGFWEGVRASAHEDIEAGIVYHDDGPESVRNIVDQLFNVRHPPTGLIIANTLCYLTVVNLLERRGYRVPQDISLISRDNDRFLSFIQPEATRYLNATNALVRKTMSMLRSILENGTVSLTPVRVIPRFVAGGSLGVCRETAAEAAPERPDLTQTA